MTDIQGALTDAGRIIERFGGIRPMATKMDVPVTTVQGWKKRDIIPENRRDDVLRAAQVNGIDLSDIVVQGAANENSGAFGAAMSAAAQKPPRDDGAPVYEKTVVPQKNYTDEKLLSAAERRAVQKSTLIAVVMLALVTALGASLLLPNQQRLAGQDQRLDMLKHRVDTLEAQKAAVPAPGDDVQLKQQVQALSDKLAANEPAVNNAAALAPLSDRVTRLEQQVTALAGPAGLQALIAKISDLQQTDAGRQMLDGAVSALNMALVSATTPDQVNAALQQSSASVPILQQVSPADMKVATVLLGIAQLRQALAQATPFAGDLALLQKISGDNDTALNDAITKLNLAAQKGVLTPQALAAQFSSLSDDIIQASLQGRDVPAADKARARLSNLFEVRKDGDLVTGTPTQEKVDRAQKLLRQGDLPGAVAVLKTLPPAALAKAQPWLDSAAATVLAQQVAAALTQRVVTVISAGPAGLPYTAKGPGGLSVVDQLQTLGGATQTSSPALTVLPPSGLALPVASPPPAR